MNTPYYADEFVTLYHGDCREVLASLPHDPASAVLTDPPYGIGVRYGAGFDDGREDYWRWHEAWLTEARRVSPVVAFTHKVAALHEIQGWDHIAVWAKPVAFGVRLGNSPVVPHWEPIFIFGLHSIGTDSTMTPDVFTHKVVPVQHGGKRGREGWATQDVLGHPTPKPEGLYARLVESFAQKATAVIDPFAGSGTTLRMAVNAGKRAVGIEVEERYCELIAKRLAQGAFDFGVTA